MGAAIDKLIALSMGSALNNWRNRPGAQKVYKYKHGWVPVVAGEEPQAGGTNFKAPSASASAPVSVLPGKVPNARSSAIHAAAGVIGEYVADPAKVAHIAYGAMESNADRNAAIEAGANAISGFSASPNFVATKIYDAISSSLGMHSGKSSKVAHLKDKKPPSSGYRF